VQDEPGNINVRPGNNLMTSSTNANAAEGQTIVITERAYRSYLNEKYFYAWLEALDDVIAVRGTADGLCIELRGAPQTPR
jgi:hypothetical protein